MRALLLSALLVLSNCVMAQDNPVVVMDTNKGSITIELPAFATKDFIAAASAQTESTITWTHGGTAGNIVTFTADQAAFDSPTFVESDSVTHITLPFRLMPTSSGNDDFTLAFT